MLLYCMTRPALRYEAYVKIQRQKRQASFENKKFLEEVVEKYPQFKITATIQTFTGGQFEEVCGVSADEASKLLGGLMKRGLVSIQQDGSYRQAKALLDIVRQLGA